MFLKRHITKCFINDVYVNQQKVWLIQTLLVYGTRPMRILASPEVLAKTGTTGFKILNNRDQTCTQRNMPTAQHWFQ
jgi:hypothetical protein